MAENMIKFLRGNVASLPQTATAGAVYFTKDEGLYLGLEDGSYHRYGDFITVADVASLPVAGAHETCMYYCVAENILAKWSGTEWVQINKQKTLAELGGVAKSVYEAKIALLEQADTDNASAISGVDTRLQAAEKKLESVATTEGLGELTNRVTTAEGEIDVLQAAIAEGGSVTLAIADAKKAGTDAAAAAKAAQDTADSKTTMAEVENKGYQTAAQVQAIADGKDEAIGAAQARADEAYALAETKTTMADVEAKNYATKSEAQGYADAKDEAIAAALKAGEDAQTDVDALYDIVGDVTEDMTVVEMIAKAQADATYDDTALVGRVAAIEGDYLKKADKDALQDAIDANASAIELLTNGVSAEEVDGVNDLIKYVKDHGTEVTGMKGDIKANADAIDVIEADYLKAEDKEDLQDAIDGVVGRMDTAEGEIDDLQAASHTHSNKAELDKIVEGDKAKWDAAEGNAKAYADELNGAMDERMQVVEGKAHEHANKAELDLIASGDKAKWDEAYTKRHEHSNKSELDLIIAGDVAKWNSAQANAEATAAEALAGAKTELEGKITAEAETARAAEKANADAIAAIVADYLKAADKTALQGAINAKADADSVYTKGEVEEMFVWGSF